MINKPKSIKISDYFQINKPKYTYLKLIPSTSVKNNRATDVASIINDIYVDIDKRFKRCNKGFSYDMPSKVSFIIDMNKDEISKFKLTYLSNLICCFTKTYFFYFRDVVI